MLRSWVIGVAGAKLRCVMAAGVMDPVPYSSILLHLIVGAELKFFYYMPRSVTYSGTSENMRHSSKESIQITLDHRLKI